MAVSVLVNPTITINGIVVNYIPNTFNYTEGLGAQNQVVYTSGGGRSEVAYADDISTKKSMIKFSVLALNNDINLFRSVKLNRNNNVITASETVNSETFTRAFNNAALINDYEVSTGPDGKIDLEFVSSPSI